VLKIIFIDDESLTVKMLKKLLDWKSLDIEVAGDASNGLDALSLVERVNPDIILVDIKMPVMDGLKFMEELKNRKIRAAVIVLSAYSEFTYAQKAISYGARDYLLKPIDENKLLEIIFKIKSEIVEESRRLLEYELSRKKAAEVVKIEYSRTLTDVINSKMLDETAQEKLRNIGKNLLLDNYTVIVIRVEEEAAVLNNLVPKGISMDAVSIVESVLLNHNKNGVVFKKGAGEIICIINAVNEFLEKADEEALKRLYTDVIVQINIYKKNNIYIGISNATTDILNLKKAYDQAFKAAENSFYEGINKVFSFNETNFKTLNYTVMVADIEKKLIERFEMGLSDKIEELLDALKVRFFQNRLSPRNVYAICYELLLSVKKSVFTSLTQSDFKAAIMDLNLDVLESNLTLDTLIDCVKRTIFEALDCIQSSRNNPGKNCIKKVKEYLKLNYSSQVTLEEVAEKVSVSKNYLCKIFKLEEGKSVWNYLTEIRIEKAKELLKNSDMKSYEIASLIGYDSMYYFSNTFKKYVGLSPMEYRNNI